MNFPIIILFLIFTFRGVCEGMESGEGTSNEMGWIQTAEQILARFPDIKDLTDKEKRTVLGNALSVTEEMTRKCELVSQRTSDPKYGEQNLILKKRFEERKKNLQRLLEKIPHKKPFFKKLCLN